MVLSVTVPQVALPQEGLISLLVVLVLVVSTISCPIQLSIQEFQTVGANPVCGSTFNVLAALARVSA